MTWPKFDPVVAINQAVGFLYTIGGVFAGGYLAFRLALKNLRNARAIERRIQWRESVLDAINAYERALRSLSEHHIADPTTGSPDRVPQDRREEVTRTSRELLRLLERAMIYGDPEEQLDSKEFLNKVYDTSMATHGQGGRRRGPRPFERVTTFLAELQIYRAVVLGRLRGEMGLSASSKSVKLWV